MDPDQKGLETVILAALNDCTNALDRRTKVDMVYFDFTKAYDKVPRLFKQCRIGLHPRVVN